MKRRNFIKTAALGAAFSGVRCTSDKLSHWIEPSPDRMKYTPLGKTGIKVSRLSFGSHLSADNVAQPAERDKHIQFGCDMGINLYDIYNHTYFQFEPMSKSLKNQPDALISIYDTGADIDGILKLFNRERIDFIRAGFDPEKLDKLMGYREKGKIRAVGVVSHQVNQMIESIEKYGDDLDYFMIPYNFVHNRATPPEQTNDYGEFVKLAKKHNYGLIGMKPFCNEMLLDFVKEQGFIGGEKDRGVNVPSAAIRYALSTGAIHTSLPAMNSIREISENLQAIYRPKLLPIEREILAEVDKVAFEKKWSYLNKKPGYKWLADWAQLGGIMV